METKKAKYLAYIDKRGGPVEYLPEDSVQKYDPHTYVRLPMLDLIVDAPNETEEVFQAMIERLAWRLSINNPDIKHDTFIMKAELKVTNGKVEVLSAERDVR